MLKLAAIAAAETAVLELRTGDDLPLLTESGAPVSVTVYGPGSKPYARARTAQQNRLVAKLQRKSNVKETSEEKAANEAEFLAAITAGDSGLDIEGLTDGLQGADKYSAIYRCSAVGYIGEQVAKFAGDWANFSTGSGKT